MAYASSRHAAWRLASATTRGARARTAVVPTEQVIARPSCDVRVPQVLASFPSRGFTGASAASPATSNAGAGSTFGGARSWLGAVFLLSPSVVCVGLCKWQLDRWEWKKRQLLSREKALAEGERTLGDVRAAMTRGDSIEEYTAVLVEGTLDCDRSVRVAPRVRSVHGSPMAGALLITAARAKKSSKRWFAKDDDDVVLVNRGWVPAGWEEPKGGACLKTKGVTRNSETPSRFTPMNDPVKKQFHWVDVPAIAAALGLPPDTPLVQLTHAGAQDRGNAAPTSFPAPTALADLRTFKVTPEDHVNYAATWGGLAIATGGGALYALAAARRGVRIKR